MKKYIIPTTDIQLLTIEAIMLPSSGNTEPEPTYNGTGAPMHKIDIRYV